MHKFRLSLTAAALIGLFTFGSTAGAAPFIASQSGPLPGISGSAFPNSEINIDFRESDPSWGAGINLHSITRPVVGALEATVTAIRPGASLGGKIFWASDDGFGVRKGEDDEIDNNEQLIVEFSQNWLLLGVFLSDLFDERNDGPGNNVPETALVDLFLAGSLLQTFNFSSENNLSGNQNNGGFYGATGLTGVIVDKIVFRATGLSNDEYSVAGLRGQVSVVPLPAALPLFLTALAGLGGLSYRRRRKAAATA